jgi:hypothetical protein
MSIAIEVEASGVIDDRDSAYPQAVELRDGSILCSYSNAGGQLATGGTDLARSTDGGRSWSWAGTVLPESTRPPTSNFLKLARSSDGATLFAYGARLEVRDDPRFGERSTEAIVCISRDAGRTWSPPRILDFRCRRLEVSSPVLCLADGAVLAPAATIEGGRLGERVLALRSSDGGGTWGQQTTVFDDPYGERGYLEHKFCAAEPGRIIATAWTIRMADVADLPNSYAISTDGGRSWSRPRMTDLGCQTLSAVWLGGDRLLALGNVRTEHPGIVGCIVRVGRDGGWRTESLDYVFRPSASSRSQIDGSDGLEAMRAFGFGFPTGLRLRDGSVLATFWVRAGERTQVRWARLVVRRGD